LKNKNLQTIKIFWLLIVILIVIGLIIYLFPIIKNLATPQGQNDFRNIIKNSGIKGFFILLLLQISQIFLFILPGEPLEILAGMCYGGVWGTIFILFSVCITTTIIFYLVRKYGKDFIYNFFKEEQIEKIEKSKWFQNPKNIEYVLVILFMIPGTPKDLLIYIGGLLPIKPSRFIIISTFARLPSIISSTLAGANAIEGNWKMMIILYIIPLIIAGIIISILKMFEKKGQNV